MLNVLTTMSTVPSTSTLTLSVWGTTTNSMWAGSASPNRAMATSRAMSASKPSSCPVNGSTLENRRLVALTPTRSRPRCWIVPM